MTTLHEPTPADIVAAWERNYDVPSQESALALDLPDAPLVLDVGAGSGSMSAWFHDAWPGARVVAIDTDVAALAALRDLERCEVVEADAAVHDLEPATVDLVFARAVVSHLARPQEALQHWASWLKPGGHLLVEDFYFMPPEHASTELGRDVLVGYTGAALDAGIDLTLARRLPSMLARAGLLDVGSTIRQLGPGQGVEENALMETRMRVQRAALVERGLLTDDQITRWLDTLDDPTCQDITTLGIRAWGRAA